MASTSLAMESRIKEELKTLDCLKKPFCCGEHDVQCLSSGCREEAAIDFLIKRLVQQELKTTVSNCSKPFTLLDCGICNGLLNDARTLSCGHSFCHSCLLSYKRPCKLCGLQSKFSDVQKNLCLNMLLSKLTPCRKNIGNNNCSNEYSTIDETTCSPQAKQSLCHMRGHIESLIHNGKSNEALSVIDASRTCSGEHRIAMKHQLRGQAYLSQGNWHAAMISLTVAHWKDAENESTKQLLLKAMGHYLDEVEHQRLQTNAVSCYVEEAMPYLLNALQAEDNATPDAGTCVDCDGMWQNVNCSGITTTNGPQCAVCTRLYLKPVSLRCGHSFCCECLERSLDFRPVCPLCRSNAMELISVKEKKTDAVLEAIIVALFPDAYSQREQTLSNELEIFSRASSDSAEEIPIFVCSLSLPTIQCMFHIFEPRYRYMLRKCMQTGSKQFGMCMYDEQKGFVDYGTMVEIQQWQLFDDGRSAISCIGGRRFKVLSRGLVDGFHSARIEWIKDIPLTAGDVENVGFLSQQLYKSCEDVFLSLPPYAQEHLRAALGPMPPFDHTSNYDYNGPAWVWWVMQFVVVDDMQRLCALGMNSLRQRLMLIASYIRHLL